MIQEEIMDEPSASLIIAALIGALFGYLVGLTSNLRPYDSEMLQHLGKGRGDIQYWRGLDGSCYQSTTNPPIHLKLVGCQEALSKSGWPKNGVSMEYRARNKEAIQYE